MAVSPADIARAAEALNRHPDLSHVARRVGLELLNCIDRRTGLAWPSEARMAEALGLSDRTIRRAKAELAALGLISWQRRGTSRKGRTPVYRLAWAALLNLASTIKERVKAAAQAARGRIKRPSPAAAPPASKLKDDGPQTSVGRTYMSDYLSHFLHSSSPKGFWQAPGTPKGQHLTDQKLDGQASTRIWEALKGLGHAAVSQFLSHPNAAQLEAEAIRQERFRPDQGRTGLAVIATALAGVTA